MKIVKPKTYSAKDMYKFWKKEQLKTFSYLESKYDTIYYFPTEKIRYLEDKVTELQALKFKLQDEDKKIIDRYTKRTKSILNVGSKINKLQKEIKQLQTLPRGKPIQVMNYTMFKEVISRFNSKMSDRLVYDGEVLNLKNSLGYLKIKKIERNPTKDHIDWVESKKLKEKLIAQGEELYTKDNPTGKKWFVYRTDEYYLRWGWVKKKGACRVKNQTVYNFNPTANRSTGVLGNKGKLSKANFDNPLLHIIYEEN